MKNPTQAARQADLEKIQNDHDADPTKVGLTPAEEKELDKLQAAE